MTDKLQYKECEVSILARCDGFWGSLLPFVVCELTLCSLDKISTKTILS